MRCHSEGGDMTNRERELEAQVAALRAALDGARVCEDCRGEGWYTDADKDGNPEQIQCRHCHSTGVVRRHVPADAGADWLADAQAVAGVAALYRKEMQTLFDDLKALPADLADMIDPLVVSHLCTQLALWLEESDSKDILARVSARGWLEA